MYNICIYVYIYMYVCTYMYRPIHIFICGKHIHECIQTAFRCGIVFTSAIYTYIYIYICIYIYMCIYMYTYIHTYVYVIYIHIDVY